jgi:hypothetical protein
VKEHPILFSAPMVRAILEGRKTQTRRIVKSDWQDADDDGWPLVQDEDGFWHREKCRHGAVGDLLWVRETHSILESSITGRAPPVWYWADGNPVEGDYCRPRPSIHMPRWASRITLKITGVRVERLNEISERDAFAEGAKQGYDDQLTPQQKHVNSVEYFSRLWESINGEGSWAKNPWVWVIEFERQAHPNKGSQP